MTWTLSCALLLLASTAIAADNIPGSESGHSNYGDMHKAKEFATEHMTQNELLFTQFLQYDVNKDGYLDRIELRAAFINFHQGEPEAALILEDINDIIDNVIDEDDVDNE
ncbi:hypothetical protein BG006_011027 [Podila minutissima]|uniref:EF-hand domain-containing protein n=1 Tax=Podila minutissima TaxID=64525 RepID=A0A9P5SEQ2_9FUNG|nr:hypothetical protein BG006_011027 [Podila minutissima]